MPVLVTIAILSMVMTFAGVYNESTQMKEDLNMREDIAVAVEKAPGIWLSQIESQKGKIDEYDYRLAIAQVENLKSKAPALAQKVRDEKFFAALKQGGMILGKQVAQAGAGKIMGTTAQHVIGPRLVNGGAKLLSRGVLEGSNTYNAVGSKLLEQGRILTTDLGKKIGDKTSNLAWETASALSNDPNKIPPVYKKLAENPEWQKLFTLIQEARERDPNKLMHAALFHEISLISERQSEKNDQEYREFVMSFAQGLIKLTKTGGSANSMWDTAEDLAAWLAAKAGRPLSLESQPEPSKTIKINRIMATGEFTAVKTKYSPGFWSENYIQITIQNGDLFGDGKLTHQEITGYKWEAIIYFDGKFIDASSGRAAKGDFANVTAVVIQEKSDVEGKDTQNRTCTAYLEEDTITGNIDGWPGEFQLKIIYRE